MRLYSSLILLISLSAFAQTSNLNWTHQGPNPFPVNVSGQINGIGRVSQVKFHASDTATLYAVSASGGLYISRDHGKRWDILLGSTKLPRGSQASVCIDRTRDSTIYLGSGDANYYGGGSGVWKSMDGGNNFVLSNTGMGNRLVIEILQDPSNANILLAATNSGVYKSTNAGANWTLKSGTWALKDMEYKPGSNGRVIYTTSSDSLYRSLDFGETWQPISNGIYIPAGYVGGRGMRVAVCPADSNIVYVAMVQKFCTIFKSIDGGDNFIAVKDSVMPNLTGYNNVLNDAGQGNYNFDFNCDPTDPTICFTVSHNIFKSTNSGATWTQLTNWWAVVHTDMHQIAISPHNTKYHYNVNDGGVWFTQNAGSSWVQRSDGLGATEIYTAASSNLRKDIISIGTQDNGELYRDTTGWKTNRGGDWSKKMSYDFKNPVMVYYSDGTRRNVVGGGSPALSLPFTGDYNAIAFSREMPDYCWVAKNDTLYFTRNVNATPPIWSKIADFTGNGIIDIHSSYADTNLFFSINRNGKLYVSNNILAATPNFISYNTPATTNTAAALTSIRKKDSVLYISCGNRIYRSNNYGASFTNISLNYPTINVKELYHDLYTTDELVIALNSDGVWYHTDTMSQWKSILKNLPTNCGLNDLSVYNTGSPSSVFRNSYYGRGVWEFPLDDATKVPNALFSADSNFICVGKSVNFRDTSANNPTQWLWTFEGGTPSTSTAKNPTVQYNSEGIYRVRLKATNAFGSYTTEYKNYITVLSDLCAGIDTAPGKAIQVKATEDNTVPPLNIITNTITIAGWVKLNGAQAAYSALYSMNGDSSKNCFTIISPNRLGYHWRGESGTWTYNTGPTMPYNEWCHIAMVISPTQATFYVNGVGTSRAYNHKLSAFNTLGYIGSELGNNTRTMNTLIDELTIYNKSLSQSEIRELMHLTKKNPNYPMHSSDSALIAYYQFNETPASGNRIFDKISKRSGNLDALTSRLKSTAPIGGGRYYRATINAITAINQANIRTSMNFPGPVFPNGELVISQINQAPDTLPSCSNYTSDNKYWIIDNYGTNSSFNAISSWDFMNIHVPQGNYFTNINYQLLSRKSFEDSLRWVSKGLANSVNGGLSGKINFGLANNIITAGQYIATNSLLNQTIQGAKLVCQNLKDTQTYSLYKSTAMTYYWSCTNCTIIGSNTMDSVRVDWANGGGVLQCSININGCSNIVSKTVGFSSPSLIMNMSPLVLCPGDSATLTASGGSSQSWNKGITNGLKFLPSASQYYSANSVDSIGCKKEDSLLVTINPNPIVNLGPDSSLCYGETASIGLVNNNAYKYKWSPSSFLSNDSLSNPSCNATINQVYTLLVTNKTTGCKASDTMAITVDANPIPKIIGTAVICKDTVNLTSDSAFSLYKWSTNETSRSIVVSSSNNFNLTVTDKNGCSGTAAKTIFDGKITNLNILGKDTICSSDSSVLTVNTGFVTYLWNTGNVNNTIKQGKGLYTCEVSNALGCKAKDSFEVFNYPFNNIQIKVADTLCRKDSTIILNYSSSLACNTSSVTFDGILKNSFSLKNEAKGAHVIKVSCNDKYACKTEKVKSIFLKDCALGIAKLKSKLFSLYPNPAKDFVHLTLMTNEPAILRILDMEGRLIQRTNLQTSPYKLDISSWSKGIYMMECTQNEITEKIKFIKE